MKRSIISKKFVLCQILTITLGSILYSGLSLGGEIIILNAFLNEECITQGGSLTVPDGTKAVDFEATMSSTWRACSIDAPIETIGFVIVDTSLDLLYRY